MTRSRWYDPDPSPTSEPTLALATDLAARFLDPNDPATAAAGIIDLARQSLPDGTEPTGDALEAATASLAHLPTALVSSSRLAALRDLPARLARRIVGQERAIATISDSVLRREIALGERRRPIGVYLFVGPTGVGKTELARALAIEHFGSESDLVRFDMGQYKEHHEALKLTGAPPSYVGHEAGGQLFAAFCEDRTGPWVQTRKAAVLLLNEFEKAHLAVHDVFLSAFDHGVITGSRGEALDLRDSIIILTSNIGVREALEVTTHHGLGFGAETRRNTLGEMSTVRAQAVQERFAPEFRNRLDAIIEFTDLSHDDLSRILDLRVAGYARILASAGLTLVVGPRLRERMVGDALASRMGARDLVLRQFSTCVEGPVTRALADNLYQRGATLEIEDHDGVAVLVRHLPVATAA